MFDQKMRDTTVEALNNSLRWTMLSAVIKALPDVPEFETLKVIERQFTNLEPLDMPFEAHQTLMRLTGLALMIDAAG